MKTRLLFCFVLWLVSAVSGAVANNIIKPRAVFYKSAKFSLPSLNKKTSKKHRSAGLDGVSQLLRLELIIDSLNYDDTLIGFNTGASTAYSGWEDAMYLNGMGAPESLSSFSSDSVPLS